MKVLLESIESLERGFEYAQKVDLPEVWSQLAKAQLRAVDVGAAVASYIKAQDSTDYAATSTPPSDATITRRSCRTSSWCARR